MIYDATAWDRKRLETGFKKYEFSKPARRLSSWTWMIDEDPTLEHLTRLVDGTEYELDECPILDLYEFFKRLRASMPSFRTPRFCGWGIRCDVPKEIIPNGGIRTKRFVLRSTGYLGTSPGSVPDECSDPRWTVEIFTKRWSNFRNKTAQLRLIDRLKNWGIGTHGHILRCRRNKTCSLTRNELRLVPNVHLLKANHFDKNTHLS